MRATADEVLALVAGSARRLQLRARAVDQARSSASSATIRFRSAPRSARCTRPIREPLLAGGYVELGARSLRASRTTGWRVRRRSGTMHRNFQGYTERRTTALLGLGVSAISETPDCYHQNEKVITVYDRRVQHGEIPTLRGHRLSADDRAAAREDPRADDQLPRRRSTTPKRDDARAYPGAARSTTASSRFATTSCAFRCAAGRSSATPRRSSTRTSDRASRGGPRLLASRMSTVSRHWRRPVRPGHGVVPRRGAARACDVDRGRGAARRPDADASAAGRSRRVGGPRLHVERARHRAVCRGRRRGVLRRSPRAAADSSFATAVRAAGRCLPARRSARRRAPPPRGCVAIIDRTRTRASPRGVSAWSVLPPRGG